MFDTCALLFGQNLLHISQGFIVTEDEQATFFNIRVKMFVLIWSILLCLVTASSADPGASAMTELQCFFGFCISLSEGEITADAGLCAVIHCSFTFAPDFEVSSAAWYKCNQSEIACREIFHSKKNKVQLHFRGRVSLLEPDLNQRNCSIIINDLDQSDSGTYQLRVNGSRNKGPYEFTFKPKASVSVKALTQKPTVEVPALTEGQQTTLTCTAPGLCSESDPNITWTWRRSAEDDSYITGNITTTHGHNSSLTFTPSAKYHSTEVTCKVNFRGNKSTQETVTLNVTWPPVILNSSGCINQSEVLTCVCISQSIPLPTIRWPLLDKHSNYSLAYTVSKYTTNSTVILPVKELSSTDVQCVSTNDLGKVKKNLIIRTSEKSFAQENGGFSAIPLTVTVVSLIVNILLIVCLIFLWNSRKKLKQNQEDQTYLTLSKRDISPDVVAQQVSASVD
uniref:Sialic acid-binding Ig-like lectin 13 n=1 Tax=Sphaeramia orbicularis TaxID=375764 RepID=A0A673A2H5_9TELE